MNTSVIITAATALIISSFISLTIIVKRKFKLLKSSSHYFLAISDVLSSLMTAIILILNKFESTKPNASQLSNNDLQLQNFIKILEQNNGTMSLDIVETEEFNCNFKTILMHYAIFLIPFANTFISLLSVSFQCNFDVTCVQAKCGEIIDSSLNESEKLITNSSSKRRKALTSFSIASQWIIPIFLTGILNLANWENNDNILRSNEMFCTFTTNFPFDNCYDDFDQGNMLKTIQLNTTDDKNYIEQLTFLEDANNSSPEIDQVVSKIYGIVESVINTSSSITENSQSSYEPEQLSNVVKFMNTKLTESNQSDEQDEINLFEALIKNSTIESTAASYLPIESTTQITIPSSTIPMNNFNNSIKSNQQIYADIIKKISSANKTINVKDKKNYLQYEKRLKKQMYDVDNNLFNSNSTKPSNCIKNQCFISTKFLRIHIFILLIMIYLLPIVLSTILNMRARYICLNILEKLFISSLVDNGIKSSTMNINKSTTPRCFTDNSEDNEKINENIKKILYKETQKVQKLSDIFRKSLILAVALWTPMFLEILMKVFICFDTPKWITNILYLTAISFGTVRNALNLQIIKIHETIYESCKNRNSIQPIRQTISQPSSSKS